MGVPPAVHEPLCLAVAVDPEVVAKLEQVVGVGIERRLQPVTNRLGLPPVLLLLDSLPERLCAFRVHVPPNYEGSA